MTMKRKSTVLVPLCLIGGGLLVSAGLYSALSSGPGGRNVASGSAAVQQIVSADDALADSGFTMPPIMLFEEIVTRPIFAPSRRPTEEEVPAQEQTVETKPTQLDLRLIGVIVSAGTPIAIVAPQGSNAFTRVSVGDLYQGWTVEQIEPNQVTFRRDASVERIELNYELAPTRPNPAKAPVSGDKAKK